MGVWTSSSNMNPSVPPVTVEQKPLFNSSAGDGGIISSLPGATAPIHIPVTNPTGSTIMAPSNQNQQQFGGTSGPIDPYRPSTIVGGPTSGIFKPDNPQFSSKFTEPPPLIKPVESAQPYLPNQEPAPTLLDSIKVAGPINQSGSKLFEVGPPPGQNNLLTSNLQESTNNLQQTSNNFQQPSNIHWN